jgi:hypothetical protein
MPATAPTRWGTLQQAQARGEVAQLTVNFVNPSISTVRR